MKYTDFICNGYNKYFLWTSLFYDYLVNPKLQTMPIKKRKQMAIDMYLKLLGKKK